MMYSEFEGLDEMDPVEKTDYLMDIVKRYTGVIEVAKKILSDECLPLVEESPWSYPGYRIKSRTTSTLDNTMLAVEYEDLYKELFEQGKLTAKVADIREWGEEVSSNLLTTKTSKWLERIEPK